MVMQQEVDGFEAGNFAAKISIMEKARTGFNGAVTHNLSTPWPLYSGPSSCLILGIVRSEQSHSYSSSLRTNNPTLQSCMISIWLFDVFGGLLTAGLVTRSTEDDPA